MSQRSKKEYLQEIRGRYKKAEFIFNIFYFLKNLKFKNKTLKLLTVEKNPDFKT